MMRTPATDMLTRLNQAMKLYDIKIAMTCQRTEVGRELGDNPQDAGSAGFITVFDIQVSPLRERSQELKGASRRGNRVVTVPAQFNMHASGVTDLAQLR